MPRSDSPSSGRPRVDWRGWLALAWALWFGLLYARMVLDERGPGVLRAIERIQERAGSLVGEGS